MQIKCNIEALRQAISQSSYTLDAKAGSSGNWLYLVTQKEDSKLLIYSSNLGLMRTLSQINAEITQEGETAISPKLLGSILAGLPEDEDVELVLSPTGARLQVKYDQIKSDLATLVDAPKSASFLKTISFNAKHTVFMTALTLSSIINRTLFCAASGNNVISEGPWLSSVYLETRDATIWSMSTDRAVAGEAEVLDSLITPGFKASIHRDAMQALKSLLSKRAKKQVGITISKDKDGNETEVLFNITDIVMGVRLIGKEYPVQYKKIFDIPDAYNKVSLNRKKLIDAIGRIQAFAEKDSVLVTLNDSKLSLATKGYDSTIQQALVLSDPLPTGTKAAIGLGIPEIQNILSSMAGESVTIHFAGDNDHVYLTEGTMFKYVLSPVTLPWKKENKI